MDKPFEHVVIIGCGLLGASLGLALRGVGGARRITGVGRKGSASVEIARKRGAIDVGMEDGRMAVRGWGQGNEKVAPADLVVVCTPLRQFPEVFREIGLGLKEGVVVTDVGSTKGEVMEWAEAFLPKEAAFVGSHPMAGSEQSGPEAARADLYTGGLCLMCKGGADDAAFGRVEALWRAVGMRTKVCEAAVHDKWVAAVSHLPHAVASCLVKVAAGEGEALEAAAGGFTDTTRIASSDVTMWTDILMTNRAAVVEMIGRMRGQLGVLEAAVEQGDAAAIGELLAESKRVRDGFVAKRRALLAGVAKKEGC